ncbi:hypothetical protein FUA26_00465 [Seonamhaeicola algicola]|uniref:Transglutaminase-like domain-containing protein n=1 Tax=Seonamhaeicola algicola TaxID=1719036 RepID=A0A5C7B3J7_9FLAO|nr:transglutaminase domain-containing protein [Seonamhaeicola algicola]TXE15014.1 hypothetical protein FUA26_00465 [Seonamhaeicola algicola]
MNRLLLVLALLLSFKHFSQVSDFEHINFNKADFIAKKNKGATLKNLPVLVHQLTSELTTDVEKFRAIYIWVCSNISNDYANHVLNLRKREKFKSDSIALNTWNNQFRKKALKKLIRQKKTICTGYAYLLQEMASLAGLNCKMVHGYGRTTESNIETLSIPNHSWNVILLNNKWYLCDPTWASGFFNLETGRFEHDYNDGYFLSEPNLFVKNHYPLNTEWLLTEQKIHITDFLSGPLVYGDTFKHKILPLAPFKMTTTIKKNKKVLFRFQIPSKCEKEKLILIINGVSVKKHSYYAFNKDFSVVEFNSLFKRKGVFDVYLKVNNDVVSTHVIKVK